MGGWSVEGVTAIIANTTYHYIKLFKFGLIQLSCSAIQPMEQIGVTTECKLCKLKNSSVVDII